MTGAANTEDRIRNAGLRDRICSAADAAERIKTVQRTGTMLA
jgi:hypothetical protein